MLGVSALAFAGCGSSDDDPATTTGAGTSTAAVTSTGAPTATTASTAAVPATTTAAGTDAGDGRRVTSDAFQASVPAEWVDSTAEARKRIDAATLANVTFSAYAEKDTSPPRANVSFRDGEVGSNERGLDARDVAEATRKQFETQPSYDVRPGLTKATVDGEDGWIFQASADTPKAGGGTLRATIRQLVVIHAGRYVQVTLTTGAGGADDGDRLMQDVVDSWSWSS